MVSDKKIFHVSHFISLCKAGDPLGVAFFLPIGSNLNKFGRGLPDDASYHISRL